MKHSRYLAGVLLLLFIQVLELSAVADTFGSGASSFEIDFVTIGAAGNVADTTGTPNPAGSVPYTYRIGKYEIPEDAVRKANAQSALDGEPLGLTLDARGPNKPATSLSWFEAATFVNWLNTSTGATPAYKFDALGTFQLWEPSDFGYDANNLFRNSLARYFLPSADEWYKAAFYDPVTQQYFDFPNGSDTAPAPVANGTDPNTAVWNQGTGPADIMFAGGPSPFGTLAQAGNVWEWEETEFDLVNDQTQGARGIRGSGWGLTITDFGISSSFRNISLPMNAFGDAGFRITSIPEPGAISLVALMIPLIGLGRRR